MPAPTELDGMEKRRYRMRVKPRPIASRAQHQHRQAFAAQAEARIAKHKRRKRLGRALDLPDDKASLRAIADRAAATHPITRVP